MAWIYLLAAGVFEIVWAVGLKYSDGFTKLVPSVIVVLGTIISFYMFALAIKTLPIGISYAIWTSIGIIGMTLWGTFFFGETINMSKIFFLLLIMVGILGLKITTE